MTEAMRVTSVVVISIFARELPRQILHLAQGRRYDKCECDRGQTRIRSCLLTQVAKDNMGDAKALVGFIGGQKEACQCDLCPRLRLAQQLMVVRHRSVAAEEEVTDICRERHELLLGRLHDHCCWTGERRGPRIDGEW